MTTPNGHLAKLRKFIIIFFFSLGYNNLFLPGQIRKGISYWAHLLSCKPGKNGTEATRWKEGHFTAWLLPGLFHGNIDRKKK